MRGPGGDRGAWPVAVGVVLAAATTSGAPAAVAAVDPLIASARLEGQFLLAGRVTKARNVPGEHKGQTVSRTWTFAATCASGQCPTVDLTRPRRTGTDRLVLALTTPGTYHGAGSFYAPLRCGGRVYRRGELVPFTVTVNISAAATTGSNVYAIRLNATYTNRLRINRTNCVASLGSDAARYHGHLLPPIATDRDGAPLSGRSPAGS